MIESVKMWNKINYTARLVNPLNALNEWYIWSRVTVCGKELCSCTTGAVTCPSHSTAHAGLSWVLKWLGWQGWPGQLDWPVVWSGWWPGAADSGIEPRFSTDRQRAAVEPQMRWTFLGMNYWRLTSALSYELSLPSPSQNEVTVLHPHTPDFIRQIFAAGLANVHVPYKMRALEECPHQAYIVLPFGTWDHSSCKQKKWQQSNTKQKLITYMKCNSTQCYNICKYTTLSIFSTR